jgi:hypothetical protein
MDSMHPSPTICNWARRVIAYEADRTPEQTEAATFRVYEKLRRQLCAPVGVDAFRALASRALTLAKSESPRLSAVQVATDGSLQGFGEVGSQPDTDQDNEVGVILIARLLGLFLTFLGEATTLRLIEDLRLQFDVRPESDTTPADTTAAPAAGTTKAFEALLREIDQLRNVSERLETLAEKHPGMEDGLVSVAGNIRNIATVLDVFTLIRSKAGGSQEDAPTPQTNGYVN